MKRLWFILLIAPLFAQDKKTDTFENTEILLIFILSTLTVALIYLLIKKSISYKKIYNKYEPIITIDDEIEKSKKEMDQIKNDYKQKKDIYSSLIKEINRLSDDLEMMDYGVYEPEFGFDTSEEYKNKIKSIREEQKVLIREKTAVYCHTEWTVGGSRAKGRTMENRAVRLTLRAFNGECDSIISKVKWNNYRSCANRIEKSRIAIDKMNLTNTLEISDKYFQRKLKELRAVYEYNEKQHEEKEERRERLKKEREEKKVLIEAEKSKKEAEKEKKLAEEALEKVKKELGLATGKDLDNKNEQIALLEQQLKEAIEKGERAKSRAEFTKQGHVYVISNIGSFGEGIYKIGLTRRLEPLDRVRELGDASVPFLFDLHAMIFSEDAPALERKLHEIFNENRLNKVNTRKEFFKATLDEIEKEVKNIEPDSEFIKTVESREFKETMALLNAKKEEVEKTNVLNDEFPDSI